VTEVAVDRSGLNPFHDAKLFITYVRLFGRNDPDFFLGFTVKPNIFGCLAARLRGIHAIPNVSGLGTAFINPGPLSALVALLYRLAFARCPIVFFQNEDDLRLFVARKIVRNDQARLLPGSGVDLTYFAPASPPSGIRFLFVGRLLGDKGVREFVEAARLLRPDHPDWKFQLLGPIDEGNRSAIGRAELDQWIEEGTVDYLGQAEDVRPFLAAATAIVLPSYREGLPRTLLEGAAMARPLIATDVPGNRRIVDHGVNGLLCAERDPHALAHAMLEVGTMDSGRRDSMGRAGRAIVEQGYAEQHVIEAYRDAMAQLQHGGRS
jgi:glycosyltransferase involved in cell wall biosynthesis